jgi:hypothetical protein
MTLMTVPSVDMAGLVQLDLAAIIGRRSSPRLVCLCPGFEVLKSLKVSRGATDTTIVRARTAGRQRVDPIRYELRPRRRQVTTTHSASQYSLHYFTDNALSELAGFAAPRRRRSERSHCEQRVHRMPHA